jgi:hypothetical protein
MIRVPSRGPIVEPEGVSKLVWFFCLMSRSLSGAVARWNILREREALPSFFVIGLMRMGLPFFTFSFNRSQVWLLLKKRPPNLGDLQA